MIVMIMLAINIFHVQLLSKLDIILLTATVTKLPVWSSLLEDPVQSLHSGSNAGGWPIVLAFSKGRLADIFLNFARAQNLYPFWKVPKPRIFQTIKPVINQEAESGRLQISG